MDEDSSSLFQHAVDIEAEKHAYMWTLAAVIRSFPRLAVTVGSQSAPLRAWRDQLDSDLQDLRRNHLTFSSPSQVGEKAAKSASKQLQRTLQEVRKQIAEALFLLDDPA